MQDQILTQSRRETPPCTKKNKNKKGSHEHTGKKINASIYKEKITTNTRYQQGIELRADGC